MRPGRENWGEYLYDLVGVIEVKRNFRQNLNNDLKRVQNLLAAFPNAFGILVVTYWNKRGKEDEKVRNVMSKIRRWETWRANRINVFCEKNLASDNVHWEGKVVDRLGILKFVQN
jgi:menaquinone-dependent protoporphyrinogen IX oxidase